MKSLIFIFLAVNFIYSQTISKLPSVGDVFALSGVTNIDSSELFKEGANITWNFSKASISPPRAEVKYISPSQLTGEVAQIANQLSNVNLVLAIDSSYTFINHANLFYDEVGYYFNGEYGIFGNGKKVYQYPLIYPLNFSDFYSYDVYDVAGSQINPLYSVRGSFQAKVDAYGTLILGNNSYNNVTRIKYTYSDTIVKYGTILPTNFYRFLFFINTMSYPILDVMYLDSSSVVALYAKQGPVNVNKKDLKYFINVYPTRTKDIVNITISPNLQGVGEVAIYNVVGTLVYSHKLNFNNKRHFIDISNLSPGIYMLKISYKNNFIYKKIIKL